MLPGIKYRLWCCRSVNCSPLNRRTYNKNCKCKRRWIWFLHASHSPFVCMKKKSFVCAVNCHVLFYCFQMIRMLCARHPTYMRRKEVYSVHIQFTSTTCINTTDWFRCVVFQSSYEFIESNSKQQRINKMLAFRREKNIFRAYWTSTSTECLNWII